jgi:hypothetical protein
MAFGCDRKALQKQIRDPKNEGVLGLVNSRYIDIDDMALLKTANTVRARVSGCRSLSATAVQRSWGYDAFNAGLLIF